MIHDSEPLLGSSRRFTRYTLEIIQNDNLGSEAEASTMADIYSNSCLTISTSSSRDTKSRCFVYLREQEVFYLTPELIPLDQRAQEILRSMSSPN